MSVAFSLELLVEFGPRQKLIEEPCPTSFASSLQIVIKPVCSLPSDCHQRSPFQYIDSHTTQTVSCYLRLHCVSRFSYSVTWIMASAIRCSDENTIIINGYFYLCIYLLNYFKLFHNITLMYHLVSV